MDSAGKTRSNDTAVPPRPGSVLYFTYLDEGDGSTAYKLRNDAWASFWFGYRYVQDGHDQYVGFTYATRQRFGEEADGYDPGPGDRVYVGQATFRRTAPGSAKPWLFVGNNEYLGETGSFERSDQPVADARIQVHVTASGDRLIAVPMHGYQAGVDIHTAKLFLRDAKSGDWALVGDVFTGSDTGDLADGSDDGIPAASSRGSISFVDRGAAPPDVHVQYSGTALAGSGQARTLGAEDGRVYVFDVDKKRYIPKKG